jgi:hypothetical protein
MKRVFLILALAALAFVLVACGGAPTEAPPTLAALDGESDASSSDAEPEATEEVADDASEAETSGDEIRNSFTASVDGAVTGNVRGMIGVDLCTGVFSLTYTNTFSAGDGPEAMLMLTVREGATAGSYPIDPAASELPTVDLSANVGGPEGEADYTRITAGSLELTAVPSAPGEAYAGTFSLTLDNFDFMTQAEPTGEVTLAGEFVHGVDELCEA